MAQESNAELVYWPNIKLNLSCDEVTEFDQSILEIVSKMWGVMLKEQGVGIAAPQIGVQKQIICIQVEDIKLTLANPHITPVGKEKVESQEGCLSFPDVFVKIPRYKEVGLTGQLITGVTEEYGKLVTYSLTGKAAIVAQHETDHVNGITMVDHLSKLKRDILRAKILKERRHKA